MKLISVFTSKRRLPKNVGAPGTHDMNYTPCGTDPFELKWFLPTVLEAEVGKSGAPPTPGMP